MVLMVFAVAAKLTVAGVSDGAGAAETVCVWDEAERDLSRNSTMACDEACQTPPEY